MSKKRNRKQFQKAAPLDPSVRGNQPASPSPFGVVGAPGTAIYGGYILNDEKETSLQGAQKYITYSEMLLNTSIVAAGVRYFANLVAKAEWTVEPADDSGEAEELAEKIQDIMNDMTTPMHRVVRRAAMYCMWGFSVQEWTAKRNDDGTIGYLDIEPRSQKTIERWDTDESGTVLGFLQRNPQNHQEIYLPRGKCIYLVDDTINDNPEGMGLFRHLIKTAKKLERYELLEAWGFETDLRGIPIARGPFTQLEIMVNNGTLSPAQVTALKAPMLEFLSSHNKNPEQGMLLDSMTYQTTDERNSPSQVKQWDIELLKGEPQGFEDVAKAIERLNRELARVLGVEQLLLGSDSAGSFALSRDKTQQFALIVDSCLKELKETFDQDFLNPLFKLNAWNEDLKPSFTIEKIQYREIQEVTQALADLAKAGLSPDDEAINILRKQLGLPDAPEVEMVDMDLALNGEVPGLLNAEQVAMEEMARQGQAPKPGVTAKEEDND
jgi:hypothetical protein